MFLLFNERALQKLDVMTSSSNLSSTCWLIYPILPVDCVGLPPEISITKSPEDNIFDEFLFRIKRIGALQLLCPVSDGKSAPLIQ